MASPLLKARMLVRVGDEESLQDACKPSTDTNWAPDWFMYGTAFDDLAGVSESTIPSSRSLTYAQFTPPPSRCTFPISKMVDASFWGRSNWQIEEA
jgi:hypothetical protein